MPTSAIIQRLIARHGQAATISLMPTAVGASPATVTVSAHVTGASDEPVVAGSAVEQSDRVLRVAQASLDAAGATRALRDGDRVTVDGVTYAVLAVDRRALMGAPALLVAHLRG